MVDIKKVKIGDKLYEYYGRGKIKTEVITTPELINENQWKWQGKDIKTGRVIDYLITEGSAYNPKIYDYEAYITIN